MEHLRALFGNDKQQNGVWRSEASRRAEAAVTLDQQGGWGAPMRADGGARAVAHAGQRTERHALRVAEFCPAQF